MTWTRKRLYQNREVGRTSKAKDHRILIFAGDLKVDNISTANEHPDCRRGNSQLSQALGTRIGFFMPSFLAGLLLFGAVGIANTFWKSQSTGGMVISIKSGDNCPSPPQALRTRGLAPKNATWLLGIRFFLTSDKAVQPLGAYDCRLISSICDVPGLCVNDYCRC
jgi:hypothetical protein